MLRLMMSTMLVVLCSGCASTTGAFFNRPVVEDRVGEVLHTVSLSADRRTVVVAAKGSDTVKFCAEPPPDTATGLKTDLDASLSAGGKQLGVKDKFETSVTVLSARNAPLDAFRTGMFALCQFYLNGAIDKTEVKTLFKDLLKTYENTQNLVSEAPQKVASTGPAKSDESAATAATSLETKKAAKSP